MKNLSLLFIAFLFLHLTTFAQWTQLADMPTARFNAASCTIDGKVYVIGGDSSATWNGLGIRTMEVYDPFTDSWDTTKAPMPTGRVEFGVGVADGKIYVIGGANTHSSVPFGTVEEYDPLTNLWTTRRPMPTPRKGAAYGVIDNKIYVAGGSAFSNWGATNKLDIYDPLTDTWDTTKAPMLYPENGPRGAVLNDTFYAIGGLINTPPWAGEKTVQIYDPTTDEWSLVADLNEGRTDHTANEVGGKIYAIGGDSHVAPVTSVEEYDPNTNSWTIIDQTPTVITLHTASVYENKIFVFGGSTCVQYPGRCPTSAVWSFAPPPAAPILIEPLNNAQLDSANVKFVWHKSYAEVDNYLFELDTTDQFSAPVFSDSTITDTTLFYTSLSLNKKYWWRVKAYNLSGWGEFSEVRTFDIVVSVEDENQLPVVFSMEQNYPNPFNPSTKIKYSVPQSSNVVIKVFDILGNEVETLINEEKAIGTYELTWYAENLPSGIYFYRLQTGDFVETKKMVFMK